MKFFCRCIACGVEAELRKDRSVPLGWIAFTAAHWPAGTDTGSLFLRMCGTCWSRLNAKFGRRFRRVLRERSMVALNKPRSIPSPKKGFKRAYKKCRRCGVVMYYDYVPGSLSNPILTTVCGHGAVERDYGLDDISRSEFYAARRAGGRWQGNRADFDT